MSVISCFLVPCCRLHREALKQAVTDPKTGIIDVGILTTGVSSSERIRRQMLAKELKKLLQVGELVLLVSANSIHTIMCVCVCLQVLLEEGA